MLRPHAEERTVEEFRRYAESWRRPAELEPRAAFSRWPVDADPPSSSVPSAVAGKAAERFGVDAHRTFSRLMFEAYFSHNRTISDREVIVEVAGDAGIDREKFPAVLTGAWDELLSEVVEDHNSAIESGIHGVPSVVVGARYLVSGAVPVDHYRRVIERVAAGEPTDAR